MDRLHPLNTREKENGVQTRSEKVKEVAARLFWTIGHGNS
jgi:hypothetical protein